MPWYVIVIIVIESIILGVAVLYGILVTFAYMEAKKQNNFLSCPPPVAAEGAKNQIPGTGITARKEPNSEFPEFIEEPED